MFLDQVCSDEGDVSLVVVDLAETPDWWLIGQYVI